ncbi:MAG TPA: protein kinase [Thermoanaerobaculia bacterium]|nr:protein kinase [Thermoanaerobaculia bacterium]
MRPPVDRPVRPERIGPYHLERKLGSGGMGVVYAAWDERLERRVALKKILSDVADEPLRRERFRREARAVAKLSHPAIVQIHDLLETPEGDWIVLEYVEGATLTGRLLQGALDPGEVIRLARDVAGALEEAHVQGLLHRDLKAENVILAPSGRAKVLDFGLAKLYESGSPTAEATSATSPGCVVGTYRAMSPEQANGLALDPRSDLFSLGVLLYEAATRVSPFQAETPVDTLTRVCNHQQPPVRRLCPAFPETVSELIDALLQKEPARRPRSAREVSEALASAPAWGTRTVSPSTVRSTVQISPLQEIEGSTIIMDPRRRRTLGEQRPLTVVCCGLMGLDEESGETAFLDSEALSEASDAVQDLVTSLCHQHSGTLGAALGHRIWLYFGYPQTREDDAARAVRAARELAVRGEEIGLVPGTRRRLALRIAVHTGPAVVVNRPNREEQLQPGATLDIATAIESAMTNPGVVVSAATRELIARGFTTESLASVSLPGSDGGVPVFRVTGAVNLRESDSGLSSTPMVGREQELNLLLDRARLAIGGMGQAVMISGEAGIGKSRLARALRERLSNETESPDWWTAYGSPTTRNTPLAPVVDLLEHALFRWESLDPRLRLHQLEDFLAWHEAPLEETVPLLAPLFSLPFEDVYPPLDLSPDEQQKQTLDALAALFADVAERRPLVLLIEDLQWADPLTLELLSLLFDEITGVPLLLVATFRPELKAPWGFRAQVTHLGLGPLSEIETGLLIDNLLRGRTMPPHIRQQIVERTDGVPLFVEEMTRMLLETGWSGDTPEIPTTLSACLAARLDQPGPAKEVAQVASVIGRTFSFELLRSLSSLDEAALQQGLDRLLQGELVHRRGAGRRARYSFKHTLIQDAAYASLLSRDRQELHRKIAHTPPPAIKDSLRIDSRARRHPSWQPG